MKNLFYCITILLLFTWIIGYVTSNTGNIMAITAMVLSRFTEGATVRSVI